MAEQNDTFIQELLSRLQEDSAITVDKDAILENYINVEYKERLEAITDEKERKEYAKKLKKEYLEGQCKQWFDDQIKALKDKAAKVKESLTSLTTAISQITATNAVPSVITVGAASSTPNPAYSLIDNAQKKHTLMATIKSINLMIQELLATAFLIHWVLPSSVLNFVETYITISSLLNAIPE